MTKVRELYWVPRLRALVKQVLRACSGCKRFQAMALATPPPGLLPTDRTEGSTPFEVIGVDFAGPIKYRIRAKTEGKAYLALCACSLKQGLFLEVLPNLATSEFLISLKRLIARRGRRRRFIPTMAKPLLAPKSGSNKLCVTRRHKTTYRMRTSSGNSTSAAPLCGEDSLSASSG